MTLTGLTETLTAVKEQLMATFMNIYSALQKKANADEVYTKDETDTAIGLAATAAIVQRWKSMNDNMDGSGMRFDYDEQSRLFSYRFANVGADAEEHEYEYSDITVREAARMLNALCGCVVSYDMFGSVGRVNLPPIGYQRGSGPVYSVVDGQLSVHNYTHEVLILAPPQMDATFSSNVSIDHAGKLKAIIGTLRLGTGTQNVLSILWGCPNLEYFRMKGLRKDFSIRELSKVKLSTLAYLIEHATNTTAITVTVHPDVYARLTDADDTEWHQVFTTAAGKEITFATPS